ncbi:MAG: sugar ABC transporter permease [Chloroflexota bacterium]
MTFPAQPKTAAGLRDGWRSRRLTNAQFGMMLVAPAAALMAWWILWLMISSVYLGFTNFSPVYSPIPEWVGLRNYRFLAQLADFRGSWGVSLKFTTLCVVGQFLVGFGLALVLNQGIKGQNLWRGALLAPWVVPTAAASVVVMWVFNANSGVINSILVEVGLLQRFFNFVGDPTAALFTTAGARVWKSYPFVMVVILSGLQTVPVEQLEAATVDGATTLQRFRYITLPHLRYTITVVLLTAFIWSFTSFQFVWIMTEGGPGRATDILPVMVYRWAFMNWRTSRAAAAGTTWLVFLLIFSIVFVRIAAGRSVDE